MKASVIEREARDVDLAPYFGSTATETTDEVPAEFYAAVDTFLSTTPGGHERLIPLLHMAQKMIGYLPFEVQDTIAAALGLTPIQVYEVVSFYHFFSTTPKGMFQLKVCMGTACFVRHAEHLVDTIQTEIGVAPGELTQDRVFGLDLVRCIGACGLAPAIMVNNEVHGNLDRNSLRKLLKRLRAKARDGAAPAAQEATAAKETAS